MFMYSSKPVTKAKCRNITQQPVAIPIHEVPDMYGYGKLCSEKVDRSEAVVQTTNHVTSSQPITSSQSHHVTSTPSILSQLKFSECVLVLTVSSNGGMELTPT